MCAFRIIGFISSHLTMVKVCENIGSYFYKTEGDNEK
jgi:hypothetical protein